MTETKATTKAESKTIKTTIKSATKAIATKKVNKDEMIQKHQQMVQFVQNLLENMENDIKRMKLALNQLAKFDPENPESIEYKDAEQTIAEQELKNYAEENAEVVE